MARPLLAAAFLVCAAGGAFGVGMEAAAGGVAECDADLSVLLQRPTQQQDAEVHPATESTGADVECTGEFSTVPYVSASLWGTAFDGWEQCGGHHQSPIDFSRRKTERVRRPRLHTEYGKPERQARLINNGHSLEVVGRFGRFYADNHVFESQQFHFHVPSEHTVSGRSAKMEMHIVNLAQERAFDGYFGKMFRSSGTGSIAVVGILFDVGEENCCLREILGVDYPKAGCGRNISDIDLGECFKEQLEGPFWSYEGSLTTPPCTEGVLWNVMQNRATISESQLHVLTSLFTDNARPALPVNGRKVLSAKVYGGESHAGAR